MSGENILKSVLSRNVVCIYFLSVGHHAFMVEVVTFHSGDVTSQGINTTGVESLSSFRFDIMNYTEVRHTWCVSASKIFESASVLVNKKLTF